MEAMMKSLSPLSSEARKESELWLRLQNMMAAGDQLDDRIVKMLDKRMQGYLFLQEHVDNRRARIEFARDKTNMAFLRDAAGGKNVWMVDDEFAELVRQDDAITLAVFGRSDKMQLHHLAFIAYKLSVDPHGHELLADGYDVEITLKKALELQGSSRRWRVMKRAIREAGHFGPLTTWAVYVRQAWQQGLLDSSNTGPFETSAALARTVH